MQFAFGLEPFMVSQIVSVVAVCWGAVATVRAVVSAFEKREKK